MTSVRYQPYHDESDFDDEVVIMNEENGYGAATQLLNEDAESSCIQRRSPRKNLSLHSIMAQRVKNERKYKYSLVSILIIGVCLIMMVNIGLGMRKCEESKQVSKNEPSICLDNSTGLVFPWQRYRLPTSLSPESYHIFLHPNLTLETYEGEVTIQFEVKKNTNYVILHSRGHVISYVKLRNLRNLPEDVTSPVKVLHCHSTDMLSLEFDFELQKNERYELIMYFSGKLTFSLGGFYLSKYKKKDGSEKVIATTQFESTDARAAFPCFDEPSFKAVFSLSMVRESNMFTLFNMPLSKTENCKTPNLMMDIFPPSKRMSTYLVAFIVSDFRSITNLTNSHLKVSLYAAADQVENTKFALDFAIDVMEYYERLFKIPFPLKKLDLVAIPDFAAGAMENWGLVTYRETALLYNPATSSIKDQDWVAIVIAHELSHQWFGDLVTMKWWNDLWLNEGFASYMQYKGVDYIKPSWEIMSEIVTSEVLPAMATDSSQFTHPISVPVTNTRQIQEMFDAISYSKGASLIFMLTDYLGETFFKGVNAYLKKFKYKNAANQDLLSSISDQDNNEHPDLFAMMQTWTVQPGFPVLKVSLQGTKIVIEQKRFLYPENESHTPRSSRWHIPLTYVTDRAPTTPIRHLMTSQSLTLDIKHHFNWFKLNHNFTGFYRVSYAGDMWDKLITQMIQNHRVFSTNNRINIVSDAFAMGRIGDLEYRKIFDLMRYVKKEKFYTPIHTAIYDLVYIRHILKFSLKIEEHAIFQSYVADLIVPLYEESAWRVRSTLTRMQAKLQSLIVYTACSHNYRPCIATALGKFAKWQQNSSSLSPDMMLTVFDAAVLHGDDSNWDYLWNYYLNSIDGSLNKKILSALARSPKIQRITFLQSELLKGVTIRSQNTAKLLMSMSSDVMGAMLTWRFVKENWEKLTKIHPVAEFSMRHTITTCLSTLMNQEELNSAEAFFVSKGVSNLKSIQRSLEHARINIYWAKNRLPSVATWLDANKSTWAKL